MKDWDSLLPKLKKHIKSGGTAHGFAFEHGLNPSLVWQKGVEAGLIKPKIRHGVGELFEEVENDLRNHLKSGGDIVVFANKHGVNKSTVSRWATKIGFTCEIQWVNVGDMRAKLHAPLVDALSRNADLGTFSRKHGIPYGTVISWAHKLGWASRPVWKDSKS